MRFVRWAVGAGVVVFVLGCSGLGEQIARMSGAEMQFGDNVALPEGFPLAVPPGGQVKAVVALPAGGMKTTTVQIEVPGDGTGILDQYEQAMKDAGMTTARSNTAAGDTIAGQAGDGQYWTASVEKGTDVSNVTLVVVSGAPGGMVPSNAETAPVAVPTEPPPATPPAQ